MQEITRHVIVQTRYPTNKASLCAWLVTRISILRNPWENARFANTSPENPFRHYRQTKKFFVGWTPRRCQRFFSWVAHCADFEIAGEIRRRRSPSRAHLLIDFRRCNAAVRSRRSNSRTLNGALFWRQLQKLIATLYVKFKSEVRIVSSCESSNIRQNVLDFLIVTTSVFKLSQ